MFTSSYKVVFHALGVLSLFLLIQKGNAFEFKVGGSTGWAVPSDPNVNNHNQWAEKSRFQIGDTLLFVYPADKDSVLCVTKEDYDNCNTESPLEKYSDGHTIFEFKHSGPYYFISGVKEHCSKNEKITVVVMADRSKQNSKAPPPSDDTVTSPPPAPSAEAPTGEEAPSPPSSTPAPSEHTTPSKSGASSISSIGAFLIGSCLLSVF